MKAKPKTEGFMMESVLEENEAFNMSKADMKFASEISPSEIIGYGKFEFQNKIIYIGFYKQRGQHKFRHGKGKLIHPTKNPTVNRGEESYEGDWVEDKMQGFGIYNYSSGDIYEGEFNNNKHEGFGKYFFSDGSKYEGEWLDHKMHGSGQYTDINNITWVGEFRNGEYVSKEQARLKEEKRIDKKVQTIKLNFRKFLNIWENQLKICTKKNYKEVLGDYFADNNRMSQYVVGPYPKVEERSQEEWTSIIMFLKENLTRLIVNVAKNNQKLSFFEKKRLLTNQLQEDLSSGQLIEIIFEGTPATVSNFSVNKEADKTKLAPPKQGAQASKEKKDVIGDLPKQNLATASQLPILENCTVEFAIAYCKEFEKWLLVHFELMPIKLNATTISIKP